MRHSRRFVLMKKVEFFTRFYYNYVYVEGKNQKLTALLFSVFFPAGFVSEKNLIFLIPFLFRYSSMQSKQRSSRVLKELLLRKSKTSISNQKYKMRY